MTPLPILDALRDMLGVFVPGLSGRGLDTWGVTTLSGYLFLVLFPVVAYLLLDWCTKPRRMR